MKRTIRGVRSPASPGLPPSHIPDSTAARNKRRNKYPAKKGRIPLDKQELVVATTMAMMDTCEPVKIARVLEQDTEGIKRLIKVARQTLQNRALEYVDAHMAATLVAAQLGDAKPAQWALERISEGEQRVVEREKAGASAPSIQIGIAVGGMPQPKPTNTLPIQELPVIDVPLALSGMDDTP